MTLFKKPTTTFQNKGLIDLRAITTLGVSVKETQDPIGVFGTGLKYALAVLARERQDVSIFLGLERYELKVKPESIRNKDFDILYLNNTPMGITTHYGMNWNLKQAYRELASNTMDEDGIIEGNHVEPKEGYTTIIVEGKKFHDILQLHNELFLPSSSKAFHTSNGVEIHESNELTKGIYYRGVQVYEPKNGDNFRWAYNFTKTIPLTEDRTLDQLTLRFWDISEAIGKLRDTNKIKEFLDFGKTTLEGNLNFNFVGVYSNEFMEESSKRIKDKGLWVNPTLREKISSLNPTVEIIELVENLNPIESKYLQRSIEVCKKFGYPVDEYPIRVAKNIGKNIHGLAKNGIIYIDLKVFSMGTKWIVSTLMEEWIHLNTGYADETRELQQYLFDKLVDALEMYVLKEPI